MQNSKAREKEIRELLILKHAFTAKENLSERYISCLEEGIYGQLAATTGTSPSVVAYEHLCNFFRSSVFAENGTPLGYTKDLKETAGADAEPVINKIKAAQSEYSSKFNRMISLLAKLNMAPEEAVEYEKQALLTIFPTKRDFAEHLNNLYDLIAAENSVVPLACEALGSVMGEQAIINIVTSLNKAQNIFVDDIQSYFIKLANELYAPGIIGD